MSLIDNRGARGGRVLALAAAVTLLAALRPGLPLLAAVGEGSPLLAAARPGSSPAPTPVVVELFTSEGCSSCPPADQLLSKLAKDQAIPGVQVIPLGMHVTYWDQLGWKDPASLRLATERQQGYGRIFGEDRVYTPQAVIDGRDELIGSDEGGMSRAIAKAARQPHAGVTLRASIDGAALVATVTVANLPPDATEPIEVWMAVTEDGLASVVKRGENGGRTLHHDAAVRSLVGGRLDATHTVAFRADLRSDWRRTRLNAVALLQGTRTHRIWGSATTPLE
jgi:hypothetical protein